VAVLMLEPLQLQNSIIFSFADDALLFFISEVNKFLLPQQRAGIPGLRFRTSKSSRYV
jgi:hypothetical protein